MDSLLIFLSVFGLVFIGELGDKTQIAAGTGTLANKKRLWTIFFSSALALIAVSGITVLFTGLIPETFLPVVKDIGGILLAAYGGYLFATAGDTDEDNESDSQGSGWGLFFSHFLIVFVAELGDKTQFATLGAAIENPTHLTLVFAASASALVAVTGITVLAASQMPLHWVKHVQRLGAALMVVYGAYMVLNPA